MKHFVYREGEHRIQVLHFPEASALRIFKSEKTIRNPGQLENWYNPVVLASVANTGKSQRCVLNGCFIFPFLTVQTLLRESQVIREAKEKQIVELKKMCEQSNESLNNEWEKRVRNNLLSLKDSYSVYVGKRILQEILTFRAIYFCWFYFCCWSNVARLFADAPTPAPHS